MCSMTQTKLHYLESNYDNNHMEASGQIYCHKAKPQSKLQQEYKSPVNFEKIKNEVREIERRRPALTSVSQPIRPMMQCFRPCVCMLLGIGKMWPDKFTGCSGQGAQARLHNGFYG
jgi:hypothetical protein